MSWGRGCVGWCEEGGSGGLVIPLLHVCWDRIVVREEVIHYH